LYLGKTADSSKYRVADKFLIDCIFSVRAFNVLVFVGSLFLSQMKIL
jgi:hypothetical protein